MMIYLYKIKKSLMNIAGSFKNLILFRESFAALLFGLGGLLAGSLLVSFKSLIFLRPWIIVMYPLVLSSRGAINGVLSGKIGTGLHTRLIEPNFRKNTRYYHSILASVMNLSILSSVLATLITFIITFSMFKGSISEIDEIFFSCLVANALSVIVMAPFASGLGFLSYKRGLDPDIFLYPISATIADIWTTICYVFTLGIIFLFRNIYGPVVYFFGILFIIITISFNIVFRKDEEYWKTLKEASSMILAIIPISAISGISLSKVMVYIKNSPGLLSVYPALINTLGAAGAIFGSLSTTKLALGFIKTQLKEIKGELKDLIQIGIAVSIMYIIYGTIAYFIGGKLISFAIILLSLIILFPIIIFMTFSIGILAFIQGLDPDNFIIPIETTLTDCLLTIVISFLIVLFYAI
ncbi:MAG: magnesium transporter [Candidatus Bathyarchaeota archaeon]|nr:magnesium transporter [Candidatus Bathyarchaeota archaeon]